VQSNEVKTTERLCEKMLSTRDGEKLLEIVINAFDDEKGHTPLMMAVNEGNGEIVQYLVSKMKKKDDTSTEKEFNDKAHGMELQADDFNDQCTALMMAVKENKKCIDPTDPKRAQITMVELLFRLGASPFTKSAARLEDPKTGLPGKFKRALDYAEELKFNKLVGIIKAREEELKAKGLVPGDLDEEPEPPGCMEHPKMKKLQQDLKNKCVIS
jgi:hypothetical protein